MSRWLPIGLLKVIYPLQEPNSTRDRPMRVLALGLGRTGTESLRSALLELGYDGVYHGFVMAANASDPLQWTRLAKARHDRKSHMLNTPEFDKILGHYEAVTDLPCVHFGVELLRAYPDAKVILNKRDDLDKWVQSQQQTLSRTWQDWPGWTRVWFEAECFWLYQTVLWYLKLPVNWDFASNGKDLYLQHYALIEETCRKQDREWLEWKVQDGWEPICKYLGKPVPGHDFPNENKPDGFQATRAKLHKNRPKRADRNIGIIGMLFAFGVAAVVYSFRV